jgi:FkbM family methyltransferase
MDILKLRRLKKVCVENVDLYLRTWSPDFAVTVSIIFDAEFGSIRCAQPRVIVDAGAYIGVSSVWFARRYPEAKIIAMEPDEENYALLLKNTREYKNIHPLKAALWKANCTRALLDRHTGPWGYTISETRNATSSTDKDVQCLTLGSLMKRYDVDHIDLLKLDIEGAEKEIFPSSATWIDKVDIITVELHDRICEGCSSAFVAATTSFSYFEKSGEKVTAYRNGDLSKES